MSDETWDPGLWCRHPECRHPYYRASNWNGQTRIHQRRTGCPTDPTGEHLAKTVGELVAERVIAPVNHQA